MAVVLGEMSTPASGGGERSKKEEVLVFLTNHYDFGATLFRLYKERWQIELFFKALKQNLKIKTSWEPQTMR